MYIKNALIVLTYLVGLALGFTASADSSFPSSSWQRYQGTGHSSVPRESSSRSQEFGFYRVSDHRGHRSPGNREEHQERRSDQSPPPPKGGHRPKQDRSHRPDHGSDNRSKHRPDKGSNHHRHDGSDHRSDRHKRDGGYNPRPDRRSPDHRSPGHRSPDDRRSDGRHDDRHDHNRHAPPPPRHDHRAPPQHRHKPRPPHRPKYRLHNRHRYIYYRSPWYNTWFLAPLIWPYYHIGFVVDILPAPYVRIVVGGTGYYYVSGTFYRPYGSGYIVVSAPVGAVVTTLPTGYVAFTLGLNTYYFANDTYYVWDEPRDAFLVVPKPEGAEQAMHQATKGRLYVYPNKGQSEEQQAKDRYECHRWAVSESDVDPTLEEEDYTAEEKRDYKRAISACLQGRDYTVK